MPSPPTSEFPVPQDWSEFENIVADVFREVWRDPYIKRYGRSGQKQSGIDILGKPRHLNGAHAAIQCKIRASLQLVEIAADIEAAASFEPALLEYIVATTAMRDVKLQQELAKQQFPFRVEVQFWPDICLHLSGHPVLLTKHFPAWAKTTSTYDGCLQLLVDAEPEDFEYDDSIGVYLYKLDTDLRLRDDRADRSFGKFDEPWARKFPDPDATVYTLQIFYRESPIKKIYFANVDGGRCLIPFPKNADDLTISKFQYAIARIVNGQFQGSDLDRYLLVAGIAVDGWSA